MNQNTTLKAYNSKTTTFRLTFPAVTSLESILVPLLFGPIIFVLFELLHFLKRRSSSRRSFHNVDQHFIDLVIR